MLHRLLAPLVVVALGASLLGACGSSNSAQKEIQQFSSLRTAGVEKLTNLEKNTYVNGPLSTTNTGAFLTDRFGRTVSLHGVNAVYKLAPYTLTVTPGQPNSLAQADAVRISSLGFNVVRVGIIWAGIEPGHGGPNQPSVCNPGPYVDPGMWNQKVAEAYIAQVQKVVNELGQRHIYALLDMHQDIWSSVFSGEGAPAWATCTSGNPITISPGRWSNNYSNPAVVASFNNFFDNSVQGGLQQNYQRSWAAVAERFKSNPWVVGYDPINEPLALQSVDGYQGRDYSLGLSCLYGGAAGAQQEINSTVALTCPTGVPTEGLLQVLSAIDTTHLLFPEIDNASDQGQTLFLASPGKLGRIVYNFHDYCSQRSGQTGNPTNVQACADMVLVQMIRQEQLRPLYATPEQPNGPAIMMTEFGATSSAALAALEVLDASSVGLSWAWWAWRYYNDPTGSSAEALISNQNTYSDVVAPLTQTHAVAVAGNVLTSQFSQATGNFSLVYSADPNIHAPTTVYVSPYDYQKTGYCVYVNGGTLTSKPGAAYVTVDNPTTHSTVLVRIEPGHCVKGI